MARWKKITAVFAMLSMFGTGYAFARRHIRIGWDRPWDPSAYWLPDVIDGADTANPSYFMRDLGWNGGNVYDRTRHMKSMETLGKLKERTQNLRNMLGISNVNAKRVGHEEMQDVFNDIKTVAERRVNMSAEAGKIWDDESMYFYNSRMAPVGKLDAHEKYRTLEKIYHKALDCAKDSEDDAEMRMSLIEKASNFSRDAEGVRQGIDAKTQIDAVKIAEISRRNAMLADVAALRASHAIAEASRAYESADAGLAFFDAHIENPERRNPGISGKIEHSKGRGFVRFESD